ncbi:glycosyltransferase [Streptomyces capparidis]
MSFPSVAVLVELVRSPLAGGHVKCWERFAEAAAARGDVDLTVYVLGGRPGVQHLSPGVRFVALRPVLGSAPLTRSAGADVTDLAPHHPALARLLPRHDVWHLTHSFAFAATAARLARRARRADLPGLPGVVGSVHTDVTALAAAYGRRTAEGLPGVGRLVRALPPSGPPEAFAAALVRRRRDRCLAVCERVLVATPSQRAEVAALVGEDRVALLGRGVDGRRFRPDPAARAELGRAHGIPPEATAVLFAGRVDDSKRVMVLAEAVHRLRGTGRAVHLVVAGAGPDAGRVTALLGRGATLLGPVPQERLARVYAACDVFALPSLTETIGNVVAEAMSCHLPVVLPAGARTTAWLECPGRDGLAVERDDAAGWALALAGLVDRPEWRARIGERAGGTARRRHRDWDAVLAEDLLPVWREAAGRRAAWRRSGAARAPAGAVRAR